MEPGNVFDSKILLIDDEKDILDLLETSLSKEGFNYLYKAENGRQGLSLCERENPDVIVLDVSLPGIDGLEVCRRLREFTDKPVLFLSVREAELDKILDLGIGDDYITKPFNLKAIVFRIKARLRRERYLRMSLDTESGREIYGFGNLTLDGPRSEVRKDGKPIDLTAKEFQLFLHLARNPDRVLSKKKLYEAIWKEEYLGDDNTVNVHMRRLREKIEDDPGRPRLLVTVKGLGYKLAAGSGP